MSFQDYTKAEYEEYAKKFNPKEGCADEWPIGTDRRCFAGTSHREKPVCPPFGFPATHAVQSHPCGFRDLFAVAMAGQ